jgi:hypothetical protein
VKIPALDDNGDQTVVHSIVFSPDVANDNSVYVAGHNIGLTASKNEGHSFDLLWDPRDAEKNGTVTTIVLSPHFGTDGTIALLVDNYAQWGHTFFKGYEANVYLSEDRGSTWRKITSEAQQWVDLVAVGQKRGISPVIMAVHQDGSLHVWTGKGDGTVWENVVSSHFPDEFPNGYAHNGVVASPGGRHLIAAFEQGGTVCFEDFNPTTRQFDKADLSNIGLYSDTSLEPDMKFVYDERKSWLRGIGKAIAFSPYYEEDGAIFAASFYSIYVSFDKGVRWEEIFRLPHNNSQVVQEEEDLETAVGTTSDQNLFRGIAMSIIGVLLVVLWLSLCRNKKALPAGTGVFEAGSARSFASDEWVIGEEEMLSSDESSADDDSEEMSGRVHIYF